MKVKNKTATVSRGGLKCNKGQRYCWSVVSLNLAVVAQGFDGDLCFPVRTHLRGVRGHGLEADQKPYQRETCGETEDEEVRPLRGLILFADASRANLLPEETQANEKQDQQPHHVRVVLKDFAGHLNFPFLNRNPTMRLPSGSFIAY